MTPRLEPLAKVGLTLLLFRLNLGLSSFKLPLEWGLACFGLLSELALSERLL